MKKLLAIDMDGTCLNDEKIITEKTMAALKRAAEMGAVIVPTTGRSVSILPDQLLGQDFYRYVISSNGAKIYDVKEKKDVFCAPLGHAAAIEILKKAKAGGLGLSARVDNEHVVEGEILYNKGVELYKSDMLRAVCADDIVSYVQDQNRCVEEVQLFFYNEKTEQCARDIARSFDQYNSAFGPNYVEIYSKQASKGASIGRLASILGVPKENVAGIGDCENDLSMLEGVGYLVAMGNAVQSLKDRAHMVVASNNLDGVAEAIEKIFPADEWGKDR